MVSVRNNCEVPVSLLLAIVIRAEFRESTLCWEPRRFALFVANLCSFYPIRLFVVCFIGCVRSGCDRVSRRLATKKNEKSFENSRRRNPGFDRGASDSFHNKHVRRHRCLFFAGDRKVEDFGTIDEVCHLPISYILKLFLP